MPDAVNAGNVPSPTKESRSAPRKGVLHRGSVAPSGFPTASTGQFEKGVDVLVGVRLMRERGIEAGGHRKDFVKNGLSFLRAQGKHGLAPEVIDLLRILGIGFPMGHGGLGHGFHDGRHIIKSTSSPRGASIDDYR